MFKSIFWQAIEYYQLAFLIVLLAAANTAHTQSSKIQIAPEVLASSGTHFAAHDLELSWTLGQAAYLTFSNDRYTLTQGFHQSEDVFLNVIGAPQQQVVITPNGDGLNDAFVLEDLQNFPQNDLQIFNRWGSIVFSQKAYQNDWQGTTQDGNALPEGTYYFSLSLNPVAKEVLYGSITIKR